jgi:hypothetical protein
MNRQDLNTVTDFQMFQNVVDVFTSGYHPATTTIITTTQGYVFNFKNMLFVCFGGVNKWPNWFDNKKR